MSNHPVAEVRTDQDILEDLHTLVRTYDPLKISRPFLRFEVHNGYVKVIGHVSSARTEHLFSQEILKVEGVAAVNIDDLFDDETLRFEIGKLLPTGTRIRINHGHVVLTGFKPTDKTVEELMNDVGEMPGVQSVITQFID